LSTRIVQVRRHVTTGDGSQYRRKMGEILRQAAAVFCTRGYHQASIRDIARATGVSLAGLYYYFSSKEHLLYLIQRHAFQTMLESARATLEPLNDAE
jgi:AcrR family transcriptional regulator